MIRIIVSGRKEKLIKELHSAILEIESNGTATWMPEDNDRGGAMSIEFIPDSPLEFGEDDWCASVSQE